MFTPMLAAADPNVLEFPKLGISLRVTSTAFTLMNISVAWYGILIAVGMILAMAYAFRRMRSFGLDSDRAIDGVIGGIIGGIIGARTYYVIFHWESYADDWKQIFNLRTGGLAIYGGIIGALLVGSIVCRLRKVKLLPMFDLTALGFLIGQCVGRWGNFTNHEAFGSNTDGLFGMTSGNIQNYLATHYSAAEADPSMPVHPCFFYESMWCLAGFILLHFISKKFRKFDGQIFLMYVVWYGAGRFMIEGLRMDSLYLGTVRVSQMVAIVSAVAAFILLLVGFSYVKRMGSDYKLYADTEESKALLREADEQAAKGRKKSAAEEETLKPAESILAQEETPAAETPTAETPAAETAPATETPAAETAPVTETPAAETAPVTETPAAETPAADTPAENAEPEVKPE